MDRNTNENLVVSASDHRVMLIGMMLGLLLRWSAARFFCWTNLPWSWTWGWFISCILSIWPLRFQAYSWITFSASGPTVLQMQRQSIHLYTNTPCCLLSSQQDLFLYKENNNNCASIFCWLGFSIRKLQIRVKKFPNFVALLYTILVMDDTILIRLGRPRVDIE